MTAGSQVQTAYNLDLYTCTQTTRLYNELLCKKQEGSMLHLRIGTSSAFAQKAAINVNV